MPTNAHDYTQTEAISEWRRAMLREIRTQLKDNMCSWTAKTTGTQCRSLMSRASLQKANDLLDILEEDAFGPSALESVLHDLAPLALCKRWHRQYAEELSLNWCKAAGQDFARRFELDPTVPVTTSASSIPSQRGDRTYGLRAETPIDSPSLNSGLETFTTPNIRSRHRGSDYGLTTISPLDGLDRTVSARRLRKKTGLEGITPDQPALLRASKHGSRSGHCRIVGIGLIACADVEECPICYDSCDETIYTQCDSCERMFHLQCMDEWLGKCNTGSRISCLICHNEDFEVLYVRATPTARVAQLPDTHSQEVPAESELVSRESMPTVVYPRLESREGSERAPSSSPRPSSPESSTVIPVRRSNRERREPDRLGYNNS